MKGKFMFLCFVILYLLLQMCVLEKVAGLQAAVLRDEDDSLDSPGLTVGVSLERGAPVLLLLTVIRHNNSFSETKEMNTRKGIFHIGHQIEGKENHKLGQHLRQNCHIMISGLLNNVKNI